MTALPPVHWTELLSRRFSEVTDEYGPNTQAVACAFMALTKTQWLQRVGEPIAETGIVVVKSWDEALTIFRSDYSRYNANGILEAPCARVDPIFEQIPEQEAWWQRARKNVNEYTALYGWLPDGYSEVHQDLMFENLYEFVSMLLAEIIADPQAECSYFRDQLTWFYDGHFPCGWEGDWPNGRMRVF